MFFPFLIDVTVRATLLLVLALLVAFLVRRGPAARRSLVWSAALAGLLLLLPASLALPRVRLPLPASWTAVEALPARPAATRTPRHEIAPTPEARVHTPKTMAPLVETRVSPRFTAAEIAGGLWLAGGAAVVLALLTSLLRARRLAARSTLVEDMGWTQLVERVARQLGLRRPISLRRGDGVLVPMTWGWRRPVVLLPADADTWSLARRRAVLLHELAHVRRGDWPAQLLAQLACALFWFHPLAWLAARQQRLLREQACDDAVLAGGTRPSEYAQHLLDLARSLKGRSPLGLSTLAMARRGQLEGRVLALLDEERPRTALPGGETPRATALLLAVVVPLACLQPAAQEPQDVGPSSPKPANVVDEPAPPAPDPFFSTPRAAPRAHVWTPAPPAPPASPFWQDGLLAPHPELDNLGHLGLSWIGGWSTRWSGSETSVWQHVTNGDGFVLSTSGEVELSPDLTDVVALDDTLVLEEMKGGTAVRRVEMRLDDEGEIARHWTIDGSSEGVEEQGRAWLTAFLPGVARATGLGAASRVRHLVRRGGVQAVFDEMGGMTEGAWVPYATVLVDEWDLELDQLTDLIGRIATLPGSDGQKSDLLLSIRDRYGWDEAATSEELALAWLSAARSLDSDAYKADLLAELPPCWLGGEAARGALADTVGSIESDAYMADAIACLVDGTELDAETFAALLGSAQGIDSDAYAADVLGSFDCEWYSSDVAFQAFLGVFATLDSDAYAADVAFIALECASESQARLAQVLRQAGASIESDAYLADVLGSLDQDGLEGEAKAAFDEALATIESEACREELESLGGLGYMR